MILVAVAHFVPYLGIGVISPFGLVCLALRVQVHVALSFGCGTLSHCRFPCYLPGTAAAFQGKI